MAFNNGFPVGYQPMYYPLQYQPAQYQQIPQTQQPQQPVQQMNQSQPVNQIQNGGFVTVRSESEARSYPVAPGTSVTFKHETAPYCYTKTMGFNQFEPPHFEKFRLVKEEDTPEAPEKPAEEYATRDDLGKLAGVVKGFDELIDTLKTDIETMKGDLYGVAGRKKVARKPRPDELEDEE